MLRRILYAIPALSLLFLVVYFHGLYSQIVVAAVGVLCMHEMLGTVAVKARPIRSVGYGFAVLTLPAYYFGEFAGVIALFLLSVVSVFVVMVLRDRSIDDGVLTVFSIAYPGMFYVLLIALFCIQPGSVSQFMVLMAFIAAIITDSFAYFTGRLIGRHKLAESISPKKTVEGAIGGAFFGICAVYMFGYFGQDAFGVYIEPFWYLVLGLVLTVFAQVGDLVASKIKRKFGVKDYGKIMGEHGGAMDRLDSVIFMAPAVLVFYRIIAI